MPPARDVIDDLLGHKAVAAPPEPAAPIEPRPSLDGERIRRKADRNVIDDLLTGHAGDRADRAET